MEGHSSLESSIAISTNVNLVSVDALFGYTQDVFNLIALCAFEIFQARGSVHGHDREDWALAESELLTPVKFHLSESGEQLIARAEVPGFHRQEIKVSLEPRRMSINEKPSPPNHQREKPPHSRRHAQIMFHVIDLPCEVNPSKAKATLNDGRLDVVMPKVTFAKSARA
jgi:HSP20 family molecular chaperone IbpA